MPDETDSYVRQMINDLHELATSMDRLLRGHNGSEGVLTQISHVKRTADDNAEKISRLERRLEKTVLLPQKADRHAELKFWGRITIIVGLVGGVIEGLRYIFGS